MDRRKFAYKAARWGLAIALGGITATLAGKVVLKKDCRSCPDYASCSLPEKDTAKAECNKNE